MGDSVKLKTATVTWVSWPNYGSYLQAYALQQSILKLGFDNLIIDDHRIVESKRPVRGVSFIIKNYIKCLLKRIKLKSDINSLRNSLFLDFKNKYLMLDNDYKSIDELNNRYNVFVAGSDQIWYPSEEIFDPYYYLAFTNKKKISYAPSIGASVYPEYYKTKVKRLLNSFSHISVREERGKELLGAFIDSSIQVVLDPTMLLSVEDWNLVSNKNTTCETPYCLLYLLSNNVNYIKWAKENAKKRGLRLVSISDISSSCTSYVDEVKAAGPSEFISLIRNAEFIYTDSFHATVFSIIYHKNFVTFQRFKNTATINQNSRLLYLFQLTNIRGRFMTEEDAVNMIEEIPSINYSAVDEILNRQRDLSLQYLKNSIEK